MTETFTIINTYSVDDVGVVFNDTIPAGTTFSSGTTSTAVPVVVSGGVASADIGTLPAGQSVTVTIVLTTSNMAEPSFTNVGSVTATTPSVLPGTDEASISTLVASPTNPGSGPPTILAGSPSTVTAGQTVTDTFTISNDYSVADTGVVFSDTIPFLATFSSGSTSSMSIPVTFTGGVATADIGTLLPGESVTVTLVLTTLDSAVPSFTDIGQVTSTTPPISSGADTASITNVVNARPPLITVNASPSSVLAGQVVIDTFTITNSFQMDDTGLVFSDVIPAGVTFDSHSSTSTGVPVILLGGVATADIGTLAAGQSITISIVLVPTTSVIPSFTNTGEVTSTAPPVSSGVDTASVKTDVSPASDLSVSISGPTGTVAVGQSLTYTVKVTNKGPSAATNVFLNDTLPAGVTFVSATPSTGSPLSPINGIITADFAVLTSGASATLKIVVTAGAGSYPMVTDTASATADEADPDQSNNTAIYGTVITQVSDLSVVILPLATTIGIGVPLTYQVTATNNGPSPATGVKLTDFLPSTVSFGSAKASTGTVSVDSSGTITDSIGALAPGASEVLMITVTPYASAAPLVANNATVSGDQLDSFPANNNASVTTTVIPSADLTIVKETASPNPVELGQLVTFTINVANNGPSATSDSTLIDVFPAGLSFVSGTAAGGAVTISSGVVTAPVGALPSGGTSVVTIVAIASTVGTFTDNSSYTSAVLDPKPTNNAGSASVVVSPLVSLSVVLTGTSGPLYAGNPLTYTAVVSNSGPSTATNVVFTDPLFPGAVFQSSSSNGVSGSVANGVVTQPIGTLAPGASATVILTLVPTEAAVATNTVKVSSAETESSTATPTSSVTTTIIPSSSLIQFAAPLYLASETGGFATITLDRTGDVRPDVTVHFSTIPGGNATPGIDYIPVSETVDFPSGVTQVTVTVPVLANPHDNLNELVALQLDSPTGVATLVPGQANGASPITATLEIINVDPVLVGPTVTDLRLSGTVNSITSIEVDTTGNLNPITASFAPNYTILALGGGGKHGVPAGTAIPVVFASYNASNGSVTLIPASPLPANELFEIVVNGTTFGAVSDLAGNPLNSVLGVTPGSNYVLTFERGTNLSYTDQYGTRANLVLTGPGTLDLDRSVNGDSVRLQVLGAVAKKTVISGSVHPKGRHTTIGSILGLGQFGSILSKLTTPQFYVNIPTYPNAQTQVGVPAVEHPDPLPHGHEKTRSDREDQSSRPDVRFQFKVVIATEPALESRENARAGSTFQVEPARVLLEHFQKSVSGDLVSE